MSQFSTYCHICKVLCVACSNHHEATTVCLKCMPGAYAAVFWHPPSHDICNLALKQGGYTFAGISQRDSLDQYSLIVASANRIVIKDIKEKPCHVCSKMNDVGIRTCYMCGAEDPTK